VQHGSQVVADGQVGRAQVEGAAEQAARVGGRAGVVVGARL